MRRAISLVLLTGAVTAAAAARSVTDSSQTRRFEVTASRYAFEPAVLEAVAGDTVELVAKSSDTDHGLAIPGYRVKVRLPKGGAVQSARFVADRPGRFPIECSEYCGSGHKRMRGELVVKEALR